MSTTLAAAPAAKSAQTKSPQVGKDEKEWKAETVGPVPEYNANLPVADIVPDWQNRHPDDDDAALARLAASIKAEGLVQPIEVRPCPKYPEATIEYRGTPNDRVYIVVPVVGGIRQPLYKSRDKQDAERAAAIYRSGAGWQIIAGERRWRAHRLNKTATIRAFIKRDADDAQAAVRQAVENSTRADLDPIEEARQMKRLADLGTSQKEIGRIFGGKSQPVVSQTLKLLDFPAEVQALFASGELSPAHGEGLGRFIPWPKACLVLAQEAVRREMDAKQMRGELWSERELQKQGLAELIYTGDYSYDSRPRYTMPADLAKKPGFFKSGYNEWAYLLPQEAGAPNLWEPERVKQDKARAEAAKKAASKEATGQSKMTPAEKAARQKKIAENKQARTESALAHVAVLELVKGIKALDHGAGVQVLASIAFGQHWKLARTERVREMAKALEIKLPGGSHAATRIEWIAKLKPLDVLRLTLACIVDRDSEEATKYSGPIGDRIEHLLGASKTKQLRSKAADMIAQAAAKKAGAK